MGSPKSLKPVHFGKPWRDGLFKKKQPPKKLVVLSQPPTPQARSMFDGVKVGSDLTKPLHVMTEEELAAHANAQIARRVKDMPLEESVL